MGKRVFAEDFGPLTALGEAPASEKHMREKGWSFIRASQASVGDNVNEMIAWIENHTDGEFMLLHWIEEGADRLFLIMAFQRELDAMNVKLRWC